MVRTLDEAIAYERGIADERKVLATKFEAVDNINMCLEYAEEHEQLAECLEELKAYRTLDKTNFSDGYNKAIDDFVEKVRLHYLGVHPDELYEKYYPREICITIGELAERLKGEHK